MTLSRRQFLAATAAAAVAPRAFAHEMTADVVIVGGGTGGVAAALAACRAGARKVVLTEETAWIGGQLTSQLVPPDENQWIESVGGSESYLDFRRGVRSHYRGRKDKPLKLAHKDNRLLNPGNGWVSRLCHEPVVALSVLEATLLPFVAAGQLTILRHHAPTAAATDGDRVTAVTLRDTRAGKDVTVAGKFFVDATEEGDLLPLAKVEFVTGTESQADTGEPHAADKPRPTNIQAFTWCCVVEHEDGANHAGDPPKGYDDWKNTFTWDQPSYGFYPVGEKDPDKPRPNMWTYRRVIDRRLFDGYRGDVAVLNCHLNDYHDGGLHGSTSEEAAKHRERARQMTLSLVHWIQTACPRSDGKTGWPGVRLCPEQTGSPDGLALAPYIRESRRVKPLFRVLEQHVAQSLRQKQQRAEEFKDAVGIGHYLYIDIHRTTEGYSNGGGGKVFPFQIPLGALVPERVTNVVAGNKNLGVTHLTNGCFRLHPIEWGVDEAAGAVAAFCASRGVEPRQVRETAKLLGEYQKVLTGQGVRLEWPAAELNKG